jgi:hypothetical protein
MKYRDGFLKVLGAPNQAFLGMCDLKGRSAAVGLIKGMCELGFLLFSVQCGFIRFCQKQE